MGDEIRFTDTTTDLSKDGGEELSGKVGDKAWYVVNTYSTHENKVKENLRRRVESMGLEDLIFRMEFLDFTTSVGDACPMETVPANRLSFFIFGLNHCQLGLRLSLIDVVELVIVIAVAVAQVQFVDFHLGFLSFIWYT